MLRQQSNKNKQTYVLNANPNVSLYSDIVRDCKTDALLIFLSLTTKNHNPFLQKVNKETPCVTDPLLQNVHKEKPRVTGQLLQKVNKEMPRVIHLLLQKVNTEIPRVTGQVLQK